MSTIVKRTKDLQEFESLCTMQGNIEIWLHDKETNCPIRRFRRNEYLDQFEKVCGYTAQFTNDCIIDLCLENDKYNFTHVGNFWESRFKLDGYRCIVSILDGEINVKNTKHGVFAVGSNMFELLHPCDKEKVIRYLINLKKFVLENVKSETLRLLVEKCFECKEIKERY